MNNHIKVVLFDDSTTDESAPLHVFGKDDTTIEVYALPTMAQIDEMVDLMLRVRATMVLEGEGNG